MKRDDEPKLWVTVAKLVIGAVILVGGVGLALWYAAQEQGGVPKPPSDQSWGIANDSPIRSKR